MYPKIDYTKDSSGHRTTISFADGANYELLQYLQEYTDKKLMTMDGPVHKHNGELYEAKTRRAEGDISDRVKPKDAINLMIEAINDECFADCKRLFLYCFLCVKAFDPELNRPRSIFMIRLAED